jgi:phage tail-like protein
MAISRSVAKPTPGASSFPDPVGELRFKVDIRTKNIGRFRECTGIGLEIETKEYMEGGSNDFVHKLPTRVKYPNIVLKRGVTYEDELLKWVWATRTQAEQVEMTISLMGPGSSTVRTWAFLNAYPVKWTGPTLNAGSNQIATETLEIVHNGMRGV